MPQSHLQPFRPRPVIALPLAEAGGWRLKRYAILAEGRTCDPAVAAAALTAATSRLPAPGTLDTPDRNHGVGVQIVHFAETAVVSPVVYWEWGSVLARIPPLRAPWSDPTRFDTGTPAFIGCVWEMRLIALEVAAWTETLLATAGAGDAELSDYLTRHAPEAQDPPAPSSW